MKLQVFVGHTKPSNKKLDPIRNRDKAGQKPKGGFWTSPGNKDELSSFEKFESGSLVRDGTKAWLLYPKSDTSVLEIESQENLHSLPSVKGRRKTFLDFESIFDNNHIDGIYLSKGLVHRKSFSDNYNLYGWDVETILWNNIHWIRKIECLGDAQERE